MTKRDMEEILNQIGQAPVPLEAQQLADQLTQQFTGNQPSRPIPKWRYVMKTKLFRYAAAAVLMFAAVAGFSILWTHSAQPAWAIDQTIEALKNENIQGIKVAAYFSDYSGNPEFPCEGDVYAGPFTLWAKPDLNIYSGSGELRFIIPDFREIVVQSTPDGGYETYVYNPRKNLVTIYCGCKFHMRPWIDSRLFEILKEAVSNGDVKNWQEEYTVDIATGNKYIEIKGSLETQNMNHSFWIQIELETKLPVRFKQWNNVNFEGQPQYDANEIVYNPELPEGIFDFVIPEGATVIDQREKTAEENP